MKKWFLAIVVVCVAMARPVWSASISDVRLWHAPERTRIVLDTSGPVDYRAFPLENPYRLVVDIKSSELTKPMVGPVGDNPFLHRIRSAQSADGTLRMVFDLKRSVAPNSFQLKPYDKYGHRLVFDLKKPGSSAKPKVVKPKRVARDFIVVIDPGHGGEDPGALGPKGTLEKMVVMDVARQLAAMINAEPGMKAQLTRRGDYYLSLRERTELARQHQADMFVSIHADAFKSAKVKGSSVYTLSRSGASSEAARWLADKENAADLIGGVSLDDKEDDLRAVLLDLSQIATIESSLRAADSILGHVKTVNRLHKKTSQQAGFAVLKSPDIPSVLVEMAFISNPEEERKLRSPAHQKSMATALFKGIRQYMKSEPSLMANLRSTADRPKRTSHEYVVKAGDTLSRIAVRHGVDLAQLASANRLDNASKIRIGDRLVIPLL